MGLLSRPSWLCPIDGWTGTYPMYHVSDSVIAVHAFCCRLARNQMGTLGCAPTFPRVMDTDLILCTLDTRPCRTGDIFLVVALRYGSTDFPRRLRHCVLVAWIRRLPRVPAVELLFGPR